MRAHLSMVIQAHLLRTVTDVGMGSTAEINANSKVLHATSVERWGIFPPVCRSKAKSVKTGSKPPNLEP